MKCTLASSPIVGRKEKNRSPVMPPVHYWMKSRYTNEIIVSHAAAAAAVVHETSGKLSRLLMERSIAGYRAPGSALFVFRGNFETRVADEKEKRLASAAAARTSEAASVIYCDHKSRARPREREREESASPIARRVITASWAFNRERESQPVFAPRKYHLSHPRKKEPPSAAACT